MMNTHHDYKLLIYRTMMLKTLSFCFKYRPVCGQPFENKINHSKLTKKIEQPLKYSGVLLSSSELSLAMFVLMGSIFLLLYIILRQKASLQRQIRLQAMELGRLKVQKQDKDEPNHQISKALQYPLTVILGLVETMKVRPPQNIDQISYNLESSCLDIIALMNQSKKEPYDSSKTSAIYPQEGDIINLLRHLTESFQIIANDHNISLGFYSTEDSLIVLHSRNPIRHIFSNILMDFIKSTPTRGSISVQVSLTEDRLQLRIHNLVMASKGLAPWPISGSETRSQHIPPSFDVSGRMAYTETLVRLVDGRLVMSSKPNSGVLCEVQLPIDRKAFQPSAQNEYSLPLEKVLMPNRKPSIDTNKTSKDKLPTILVIEENIEVAVYLKESLEPQYDIQLAVDSRIGATMALQIEPDLIITDLPTSPPTAAHVIDDLIKECSSSSIPVIMLTGKTDGAASIVDHNDGNEAYLRKPFKLAELHNLINTMIKKGAHRAVPITHTAGKCTSNKKRALNRNNEFINRVLSIVSENYSDESFGLTQLCEMLGMSRSQLFRKMRTHLGMAPADYIRCYRLQQAKRMLENSHMNVSEVAWKSGYKNTSHFSTSFLDAYGYSPSDAARG